MQIVLSKQIIYRPVVKDKKCCDENGMRQNVVSGCDCDAPTRAHAHLRLCSRIHFHCV